MRGDITLYYNSIFFFVLFYFALRTPLVGKVKDDIQSQVGS